MAQFVDTNFFLRFLTNDVPEQAQRAENLLKKAESGAVKLFTSDLVIAEIAWTLESFYKAPREEIALSLRRILAIEKLRVPSKKIWLGALEVFLEKNLELIDAFNYTLTQAEKIDKIYSLDQHFDQLPDVKRR